jgi:hypothetical protein
MENMLLFGVLKIMNVTKGDVGLYNPFPFIK